MTNPRPFPLGVQLTLPEDFQRNRDFADVLGVVQSAGLVELELNVVEPRLVDPGKLRDFLAGFGLSLTRVASGALAKKRGLSLSSGSEELRRRSTAGCIELLRFAEPFKADVIIGLLKGAPEPDRAAARDRLRQSIAELADACPGAFPVLLEATNRYESAVANTLEEAAGLVEPYRDRGMAILPDTFHMNIEESDSRGAMERFRGRYRSVHVSDNNRRFPGFGELDFARIIRFLADIGYTGSLVLEGNARGPLKDELEQSIRCLDRLAGPAISGKHA